MESIPPNTSATIPIVPAESSQSSVPMALTNQITYTYLPMAAPTSFDSSSIRPIQSTNLHLLPQDAIKSEPNILCSPAENSNQNSTKVENENVDNTDYRAWILEAIDKLRERKARPDAEKISVLLKRYHNVSLEETKACLSKLADAGIVVCVDYKGNVSYRNPSKWRKVSNGGGVLNTPSISSRIVEIVRQLTNEKVKLQSTASGSPVDLSATSNDNSGSQIQKPSFTFMDIETAIRSPSVNPNNPDVISNQCGLQGQPLRVALERECTYGKLMKCNGNYLLDENGAVKKKLPTKKIKNTTLKMHTPLTIATTAIPVMPAITTQSSIIQPLFRAQNDLNKTICANYACLPIAQTQPQHQPQHQPSQYLVQQAEPSTATFNAQPITPYKQEPISDPSSPISYRKLLEQSPPLAPTLATTDSTTIFQTEPAESASMLNNTLANGKGKLSRRGRPPGSKNRKSSDSSSQPPNKKSKFEYPNGQAVPTDANSKPESLNNNVCRKCGSDSTDIEDFLTCKDCSMKAHPSCIGYWAELTERARMSPWQCSDCKTCCICQDSGAPEQMLICDTCDKGYHATCHNPPVSYPVDEAMAWVCHSCQLQGHKVVGQPKFQQQVSMSSASSISPTGRVKPPNSIPNSSTMRKSPGLINSTTQPFKSDLFANNNNNASDSSEEVDPRTWSVDDVAQWLVNEGFQREAKAFKEQEIDGPCLLLMKRMDVLTELGIKLGPAVKIYERIKRFQNKGVWSYGDVY